MLKKSKQFYLFKTFLDHNLFLYLKGYSLKTKNLVEKNVSTNIKRHISKPVLNLSTQPTSKTHVFCNFFLNENKSYKYREKISNFSFSN